MEIKKWAFFAVIITCEFIFCCDSEEQKPGISTIKNISTNFDVTYRFKDDFEYTTVKNSESTFERSLYDYIKSYEPSKRVLLKTEYPHKNDIIYTFNERNSYTVKVNNATGENVTLSADGWMDIMTDITNGNADDDNHTGKFILINLILPLLLQVDSLLKLLITLITIHLW
ncbi:MAG: hypothetical protein LBV17_07235 [Treponema sp.]|jgi:hypothetical protein|nr:hypothetical protein [Treponema sp.]